MSDVTSRKYTKAEQAEAIDSLKEILEPGDTVHVIQRHVARSGMMRHLSLFKIGSKGGIRDITRLAAAATGQRLYDHWSYRALHVGGAGMDMHFHTVYGLSSALWRDGVPCTGHSAGPRRCMSNDHSNDWNTGSQMFAEKIEAEGREYPETQEGREAYCSDRAVFIAQQMDTGDLGYHRTRMHSDGGYALTHLTL